MDLSPKQNDSAMRWEKRIDRAQELRCQYPAATDPLRFYERMLGFQRELGQGFKIRLRAGQPLREQIDLAVPCSKFPILLDLAVRFGPTPLASRAQQLQLATETNWRGILQSTLALGAPDLSALDLFFGRVCLQPIAEELQRQLPTVTNYSSAPCPACGGLPQLAILRPEGEGASRYLQCSFCLREWLFRRIVCAACGEEDKEKLPLYSAEECGHVRVEACDTCKRYLKAVDMTMDGHAEPLVDEAAAAVLDVWAGGQGYTKVVPNLIGF